MSTSNTDQCSQQNIRNIFIRQILASNSTSNIQPTITNPYTSLSSIEDVTERRKFNVLKNEGGNALYADKPGYSIIRRRGRTEIRNCPQVFFEHIPLYFPASYEKYTA